MVNCCAPECDNDSEDLSRGVSFFHFPTRDEELLKKWTAAIGRPSMSVTRHTVLCSEHFKEEDFHNSLQARLMPELKIKKRLKPDAVPSIVSPIRKPKEVDVIEQFEMRESLSNVKKPAWIDGTLTITCGSLTGLLHRDKFICPGIHQECIEIPGGDIVTPKIFSVMGDKEKLKDWKNAIRINGSSVRKMMDSGELEFWDHDEICTGRCVSRNAGGSKYDTGRFEKDGEYNPVVPFLSPGLNKEHAYTVLRQLTGEGDSPPPPSSTTKLIPVTFTPMDSSTAAGTTTAFPQQTLVIKQEPSSEGYEPKTVNSDKSASAGVTLTAMLETRTNGSALGELSIHPDLVVRNVHAQAMTTMETSDEIALILDENQTFWRGILEVGLIDDFFREIKTSLDVLKNDLIRNRVNVADSKKISQVVTELGLMTKLKWKLAAHKTETEKQKERLYMEIEALKRRVTESEYKQKELKRKAECFDQLMEIGRPKRTPTSTPNSTLSNSSTEPSAE